MTEKRMPPVHPGEILLTLFLEPLELSQNALARELNVPPRRVNEIVNCNRASKQLAGLMGGDVGVESEHGVGSTFWFTARLGKGAHKKRGFLPAPDLRNRRVLVVDDQPVNQELMQLMLWPLGCGGMAEVLLEVLMPNPLLVICGGGPVGQALAANAAICDLDPQRAAEAARRFGAGASFTDADADLPFVREADLAVRIGPGGIEVLIFQLAYLAAIHSIGPIRPEFLAHQIPALFGSYSLAPVKGGFIFSLLTQWEFSVR